MPFTRLDELTQLIAAIGFSATSLAVLVFNVLTVFFVKRDFGTYRSLLISSSLLGFLFSSCEYVVHPMLHSYNGGFIYFTESHSPEISNEAMKLGLVAFCSLYGSTVCFIAVQFLYRYWALFDVSKLNYFEGRRLCIWFVYSFSIGVTWAIGIYHFLEIDQFSAEYLQGQLHEHYGLDITKVPSFTSVIYTHDGRVRWWNVCCTVEMTMIIGSQYLIICFCGNQMSVGMKEKISMLSHTRRRLHTQFFKSLVLQIAVPTAILFLPMISIIYLPLFNLECSIPSGVLFSAFALYPAIDIVIIVYIVSDYSTALRNLIVLMRSFLFSPCAASTGYENQESSMAIIVPSPTSLNPPVHIVEL